MKNLKKIMAVLIAAVMVFAMGITVFAADHTVSTTSTEHTYQIFQVFTGTVEDNQLVDLKYGQNATGTAGSAVSQADMTALAAIAEKTYTNDQDKITDLSPYVNLNSTPIATIGKGQEKNNASLAEGYYVIRDYPNSLSNAETYTLYLFKVLSEDLVITPKSDSPESVKKVQDINDSDTTPTLSDLQDSADYDIGDSVPYTLTFTLPSNYSEYKTYYVQFVDEMSAGLTFNNDAKIYYGAADTTGTAIAMTSGSSTEYSGGTKITYTIENLKTTAANLSNSDVITIKYTATLNKNAAINSTGNPNKYRVIFSNNPNESGTGTPSTGETPWDVNIVFTYKTVFNKVDGDSNPLTGADFKLEKKVNGEWVDVTTLGSGENKPYKTTNAVAAAEGVEAQAATQFTFAGLDDGEYKLTETATPTGYNEIEPITFTITATHEILSDNPGLTSLTGTDGEEFNMVADTANASLSTNIVNHSGTTLPSTGGIGTTIFYIIGGVIVLAAVIILVVRSKKSSAK